MSQTPRSKVSTNVPLSSGFSTPVSSVNVLNQGIPPFTSGYLPLNHPLIIQAANANQALKASQPPPNYNAHQKSPMVNALGNPTTIGNVLMPSFEPNNVHIKQEFPYNNKLHHGNSLFNVQQSPSTSSGHHCNKHICAVCCDRASGKHYGVYSCEGCKGFFKRTVRKYLTYTCRDDKNCVIDKRQRNRCQYCRYQKCLEMGMKKEAVQDERQKHNTNAEEDVINEINKEMPVEKILEAETMSDQKSADNSELSTPHTLEEASVQQLYQLVDWAKRIPHFKKLHMDDQVTLLRAGWNELLIAAFSHKSISVSSSIDLQQKDSILLSSGHIIRRCDASKVGMASIFDRVTSQLVTKMHNMKMDRTELGCLRAIILFNPNAKDLHDPQQVEYLREKVYASLEIYCRSKYPQQTGRFAKLLLRLPALRSIALKCSEFLFVSMRRNPNDMKQFLHEKLA